jgi:hypothetical protein
MTFNDPTIKIKGIDYPVRFGHRCISIYSERTGSLNITQISASQFYDYYYAAIVAGCRRHKVPEPTHDEYLNALDDDPVLFDLITQIRIEQETPKKETSL